MRALPILLLLAAAAVAEPVVESHRIRLRIDPLTSSFESEDRVTVQGPGRLAVPALDGVEVEGAGTELPAGTSEVLVRFRGRIRNPVEKSGAATWVAGDRTAGTIGPEGSYLVRGFYVPSDRPALFEVEITVPLPHRAVSQGRREEEELAGGTCRAVYASEVPMDGLVVVTGPWEVDEEEIDGVSCRTYLYAGDRKHKDILLASLRQEVPRFQAILGPVPDGRFDVVENFFETGYGFPNFTLLGDTVIRYVCARSEGVLPAGYLDHELVHCWLGNHLLVDYAQGNWCEALTTYLANYGAAEREGTDAAYRRKVARSFGLRVGPENDYPLREFRQKIHAHENDIGYGKGSMLFHMLAREVGRDRLLEMLRGAVAEHGGRPLGWDDLLDALGPGLKAWCAPWLDRKGAPVLEVGALRVDGNRIVGTLVQAQAGEPFPLRVPVRVTTEKGVEEHEVKTSVREAAFAIVAQAPPRLVELDPDHHVFRVVPRERATPCLEAVQTAPRRSGFGSLELLGRLGFDVIDPALPADRAVLAIGLPEALRADVLREARRQEPTLELADGRFSFRGEVYDRPGDALLLTYARAQAPGLPVTFFWGNGEEAYARARYLPYYASDTFVVFRDGRPVARGTFEADRAARAEITDARRGPPDPLLADLLFLVDPAWEGREAGTNAAYRLANELRGRIVGLGLGFVKTPPVALHLGSVDGQRLDLRTDTTYSYFEGLGFFPFHLSASAEPAVEYAGVAVHPAEEVKGAFVLLPEDAPHDLAREYEAKGAAVIGVVASEETLKARGAEAAWLGGLPASVAARHGPERANPAVGVAGMMARAEGKPLGIPYVYLSPRPAAELEKSPATKGKIAFVLRRELRSTSNIVGVLGNPREPGVLLGAHWDGVGEIAGRPAQGAADNAAGVAAVLWAADRLARDLEAGKLKRPVVVALFGGEETGLAGSRQLAALLRSAESPLAVPVAAVNVDAIGSLGRPGAYLVGRSHHPELLAAFERALASSPLALEKDIDAYAFEHGSDHWPLHRAGIPAVTVWSADYRAMNTPDDTLDRVDVRVVREIAQAVYRTVLDLATR